MKKYDAIVILGTQPNTKTWKFPKQVYDCLDKAVDLLNRGVSPYVIVSGQKSITVDRLKLKQPFRECDAMADYLKQIGVSDKQILREGKSKDSLSNLFYIKELIIMPKQMNRILFVIADYRLRRLRYLCKRIFGKDFDIDFLTIPTKSKYVFYEQVTMKIQSTFLRPMKDGDHEWLRSKFFKSSIYK